MSVDTILIKRHNHRVHPCDRAQKLDLLKYLIALHADKEIVIIASQDISALEEKLDADNITLTQDSALLKDPKVKCDMVISIDLAKDAESYIIRLNQTHTYALLLADDKDQQELYKIETAIKRTLTEEIIKGFEPVAYLKDREAAKDLKARQEYNQKNQEERDEKRKKAWAKQKKESKYLGKDEEGKAMFSGKTGERNHRYDGTPRSDDEKKENAKYKSKKQEGSKPWDKKDSEKKSWDKDDKKPWDKKHSDKDRSSGDWRNKPAKDTQNEAAKRPSRVIKLPKQSK